MISRAIARAREKASFLATQGVPKPDLFEAKVGGTAWKSKPSWYISAKKTARFIPIWSGHGQAHGATIYRARQQPCADAAPNRNGVIDVIRTARKLFKSHGSSVNHD